MAYAFRTRDDDERGRQLGPAGNLKPRGENEILIEDAAAAGMNELQETDSVGALVYEDGRKVPLAGKDLLAAAKAFAERRDFVVARVRRPKDEADSGDDNDPEQVDDGEPVEHVRDPETGVTVEPSEEEEG